jgi:ATP-dependent DNA helicase RecQ
MQINPRFLRLSFIFHDTTLAAIAEAALHSLAQLQGISGLGVKKLEAYGAQVLRVCNGAV